LGPHCDFFLLSDSVRSEVREAEDDAVRDLRPEFGQSGPESGRLFLLRRSDRENFKAGNIANFLRHHGADYDFMLVLDADSVMLGTTIRRLILTLQRRPRTAVLQSLMSTFRGATPFAQAMQFSISRLGPIFSCGFAWFLGAEALYWGHNALIRIEPFMAYAQLPIFPGKPPLGGRVLSQDVHEASLLGRAGWDVELDLEPGGSFEEIPSNVISYGRRDQRWCTGDFLNSALILAPGFRTGQRVWLAYAMCSYGVSVVLVALMLIGFALAVRQGGWTLDAAALGWALIYMPVVQFGSKLLLFFMHLDRAAGLARQAVSLLADVVAGLVLTPLLVYQHVTFVLGILVGTAVEWKSPSRNPGDGLDWHLAARVFWVPTLVALVWFPLALQLAPAFLFFSGTILFPWLLSIPLAVVSSDPTFGAWLRRHGVFACPRTREEIDAIGALADGTSDDYGRTPGGSAPPVRAAGCGPAAPQAVDDVHSVLAVARRVRRGRGTGIA
jgi:membrane glycosyltransferase